MTYEHGELRRTVLRVLDGAAAPMWFDEIARQIGAETRSQRVSLHQCLRSLEVRRDIAQKRVYGTGRGNPRIQWFSLLNSKSEAAD